MNRSPSSSTSSSIPVLITMIGLSRPIAMACRSGILLDVQLRNRLHVQRGRALVQHLVDVRILARRDADRGGEVEPPYAALADGSGEGLQDRVEAGNGTQRHQGTAVGRMLVRARADVGKPNAPTTRRQGFRRHAQQRTWKRITRIRRRTG